MCLRTTSVINPTKKFARNLSERFFFDIKCGKCAECRQQKKDEWYLRTYSHTLDYIQQGGFVLFDTLTYDDSHLPHLSDFCNFVVSGCPTDYSCFNYLDIRLFLVRLRRYLSHDGYRVKDGAFTYLICSEYGTDDIYTTKSGKIRKATERPHYHCLFFCRPDSGIKPSILSDYVDKSWQKGRTDGYMYHPEDSNYLDHVVLGSMYCDDDNSYRAVTQYVSKYVLKNSDFSKRVKKHIDDIFLNTYGEDWRLNSLDLQDEYDKILKHATEFHIQSQGFGLKALELCDDDRLYEDGVISIPDCKYVKRDIPLPKYLEYKKFYTQVKYSDGRYRWRLNNDGLKYKALRFNKNVQLLANRIYNFFLNTTPAVQKQVMDLLDGRSFDDYAEYILAYRGKIRSVDSLIYNRKDDLQSVFFNSLVATEKDIDADIFIYNYSKKVDSDQFPERFVSSVDLGSKDDGYLAWNSLVDYLPRGEFTPMSFKPASLSFRGSPVEFMQPKEFIASFCYDEDSDPSFHDYDKLLALYNDLAEDVNNTKQEVYDSKVRLSGLLRALGYDVSKIT